MSKPFLTEQELALGCARSDRDAQAELYTRYAGGLYALCLRYIEDREEARDVMHDAMIKAMDNFKSFRYAGEGSINAWISRIAVNMAIDRLKENRRFRQIPIELVSEGEIENALEPDAESVRSVPDDVLDEIIASLSPVKRTVFNMFCIDGFSHKEIAGKLGITERGSTSIMAKARASVRKAIQSYINKTGL
ncbi:MAG: sigma-70 family RNA polymerase sigma factor [Bacteroidaceae bacterium]|nr:sigma-70 family RNA polymerase sigma factor [Bacteroidaceae bacterium]